MTSPIRVNPIRRNLKFDFDYSRLNDWHYNGRNITHFMNTLSLFFPEGEQFFIDSVRYYRDKGVIKDEELLQDIRAFIGQEAMHSREHDELNQEMERQGLGAAAKDKFVGRLLKVVNKTLPPSLRLSATCALEHLTANLADTVLQYPNVFDEGDNTSETVFADAWRWHALEETEHKGVAYDVYQMAVGKDSYPSAYLQRVAGHVLANAIFWPIVVAVSLDVSRRAGAL
ncbi:MAG: metal-dependent hydrolase, partial [Gammaproteobacteria bacterium]|nr:metal-dependent hydrolase [Gammaproteobacteria bacterium]